VAGDFAFAWHWNGACQQQTAAIARVADALRDTGQVGAAGRAARRAKFGCAILFRTRSIAAVAYLAGIPERSATRAMAAVCC